MNILWFTNILLPDAESTSISNRSVSGSWMNSSLKCLLNLDVKNKFCVVAFADIDDFYIKKVDDVIYIVFSKIYLRSESGLSYVVRQILNNFRYDLIHFHGTEYGYPYLFTKYFDSSKVIISVQGLVSEIWKSYSGDLGFIFPTIRDFLKLDFIVLQKNYFRVKGKWEIACFVESTENVIGRTLWDREHVLKINPNLNYFHCNETMRPIFYRKNWCMENCEKYSIFATQGHYPLKGIHVLLKAVALLKRRYSNIQLYIAGLDIINIPWYKLSAYSKYVQKLIKRLDLEDIVHFVGPLVDVEMLKYYLKCNVFVSSSFIENSSNSICEAQLLGVPVVASYVGGSVSLIEDKVSGLFFQSGDYVLMADRISLIFDDVEFSKSISFNSRKVAKERHDESNNAVSLLNIYDSVLNR